MRVIARNTLISYWQKHPNSKAALEHWYQIAKSADWESTGEVIASFSKAKTVSVDRVRFEVMGGDHRLIVAFDFVRKAAFIKFIGTHKEYDRIDAATVSQH